MAATALVLLATAAMAAGGVLAVRAFLRALLRRTQRRMLDDMTARYRELDHDLDRIWHRR